MRTALLLLLLLCLPATTGCAKKYDRGYTRREGRAFLKDTRRQGREMRKRYWSERREERAARKAWKKRLRQESRRFALHDDLKRAGAWGEFWASWNFAVKEQLAMEKRWRGEQMRFGFTYRKLAPPADKQPAKAGAPAAPPADAE